MQRQKKKSKIICAECGKEKEIRSDMANVQRFCSRSCGAKNRHRVNGPENHPAWKGGRRVNHNGYIELCLPNHHRARGNGYVFEHIVIAEQKIGRKLSSDETVHHKDKNKQNNNPDNLEVISRSDHTRLYSDHERVGEYRLCIVCDKPYYRKPYHIKRFNSRFCSRKCQGTHTMKIRYGKE